MKVALINGSSRGKKATSLNLLNGLKGYIENDKDIEIREFTWSAPKDGEKTFCEVSECDVLVYSFPLYVDSIPSHLLSNLMGFEEYIKKNNVLNNREIKVYAIVNNGFFDGKQNCLALECMEHFCNRAGLLFKEGIGIGGGGMILSVENVPFGHGPKKIIGEKFSNMAENIKTGHGDKKSYIEPNFPKFLYKLLAEFGWRRSIRKNGLKIKDLGRRK